MDIFCASLLLISTDSGHVVFSAINSSFPIIVIFVTDGLYTIFGYRAVSTSFHAHNCNESLDRIVKTYSNSRYRAVMLLLKSLPKLRSSALLRSK